MQILIIELKKLVLLCQHKLHMKPITSLYSVNSTISSALNFVFYVFCCNMNEKNHIRGNINSKKKKGLYVNSVLLLFSLAKN